MCCVLAAPFPLICSSWKPVLLKTKWEQIACPESQALLKSLVSQLLCAESIPSLQNGVYFVAECHPYSFVTHAETYKLALELWFSECLGLLAFFF